MKKIGVIGIIIIVLILFSIILLVPKSKNIEYQNKTNIESINEETIQLEEDLGDQSNVVNPSLYVATDGLGREITTQTNRSNKTRYVGMFYFIQHWTQNATGPYNLTTIYKDNKGLKKNPTSDSDINWWKKNYPEGFFWWDEPIYGYYMENDEYVLRKQAELLADAGVDFVYFDCTNLSWTYPDAYKKLLKVWKDAQNSGVKVPKIVFFLQMINIDNYTDDAFMDLYNNLYNPSSENYKLYSDLFFKFQGKPLILLDPNGIKAEHKSLLDKFTVRQGDVPSFKNSAQPYGKWGWMNSYPQGYYVKSDGTFEETSVSVAQNANYATKKATAMNASNVMGRSYTANNKSYTYKYRGKDIVVGSKITGSTAKSTNVTLYGRNFQEQWNYAIGIDPEVVLVTGWNEWLTGYFIDHVGAFDNWESVRFAFPDAFDAENSRDIEPSKGVLKDHYYYQLVDNIRKYKGVTKQPTQKTSITINKTNDWNNSNIIEYNTYTAGKYGKTRDSWSYGLKCQYDANGNKVLAPTATSDRPNCQYDYNNHSNGKYTNKTFRNDIKKAKVSYDASNIYFYVETVNKLSSYTDSKWMRLLIDTKSSSTSTDTNNWEEFEYIVNRDKIKSGSDKLILERFTGGWKSYKKVGEVSYKITNNVLEITIPRKYLELTNEVISFNFKWCDNNLSNGDIMTVYTDGDAAPGGRFAYHFEGKKTYKEEVVKTPTPTPISSPSTYKKGDVNGDGKVNSTDYIIVRKHILKQTKVTGAIFTRADLNNDKKITSLDYIAIRKIILKNK